MLPRERIGHSGSRQHGKDNNTALTSLKGFPFDSPWLFFNPLVKFYTHRAWLLLCFFHNRYFIRVFFQLCFKDELPHTDQYVLRWESDLQIALGKSVSVRCLSVLYCLKAFLRRRRMYFCVDWEGERRKLHGSGRTAYR